MGFFDLLNDIDSGNSEKEYKLLEPGMYEAVVKDVTLEKDKQDNTMYVMTFEILNENTKAWLRLRTSASSVKFTAWQLSALNVKDYCKDEDSTRDALEALIDSAVYSVECTHNEWNGKTYLNMIVKEFVRTMDSEPSFDPKDDFGF